MNAVLQRENLAHREISLQADLPLAADGVLRYVWESRFGPMLIEAREGRSYVNGQAVVPVEPAVSPSSRT